MVLSRVKARTHEIEIFGNYFIQFRTVNKRLTFKAEISSKTQAKVY